MIDEEKDVIARDIENISINVIMDSSELSLPLSSTTELTRLYAVAKKNMILLDRCTTITPMGNEIIVMMHPDFKWWADYARKIATSVGKMTQQAQTKELDSKLKLFSEALKGDSDISQELRERLAREMMINAEEVLNDDDE